MKSGNSSGRPQTAVDRESALRHAVLLVAVHGAEIRSTLKCRHIARPVGVKQQPEAREAEIRRQLVPVDAALAVVEHGRVVGQLLRVSVLDAVDPHWLRDRESQMEEPRLKPHALAGPQRVIVAKADRLPLIPAELCDRSRQLDSGWLVRRGSHRSRQALELRVVERLGGAESFQWGCRRCRLEPAGKRQCSCGKCRSGLEKLTSRHANELTKTCAAIWRRDHCTAPRAAGAAARTNGPDIACAAALFSAQTQRGTYRDAGPAASARRTAGQRRTGGRAPELRRGRVRAE